MTACSGAALSITVSKSDFTNQFVYKPDTCMVSEASIQLSVSKFHGLNLCIQQSPELEKKSLIKGFAMCMSCLMHVMLSLS